MLRRAKLPRRRQRDTRSQLRLCQQTLVQNGLIVASRNRIHIAPRAHRHCGSRSMPRLWEDSLAALLAIYSSLGRVIVHVLLQNYLRFNVLELQLAQQVRYGLGTTPHKVKPHARFGAPQCGPTCKPAFSCNYSNCNHTKPISEIKLAFFIENGRACGVTDDLRPHFTQRGSGASLCGLLSNNVTHAPLVCRRSHQQWYMKMILRMLSEILRQLRPPTCL